MNAVLKRWCKNLRSGKYKQGQGYLCVEEDDGPKFCCWGVFADTELDDFWILEDAMIPGERLYWGFGDGYRTKSLNWGDIRFAGINSEHIPTLESLNDNGFTFAQIADWIEANL